MYLFLFCTVCNCLPVSDEDDFSLAGLTQESKDTHINFDGNSSQVENDDNHTGHLHGQQSVNKISNFDDHLYLIDSSMIEPSYEKCSQSDTDVVISRTVRYFRYLFYFYIT